MNALQRDLLRGTLARLRPIPREFGEEFYETLFRLDPSLRVLFRGRFENQAAMFVTALHSAAIGLVEDGFVAPSVHELGRRHADYGVRDAHYDTFREALLETLERRLGAAFTADVREAWRAAYDALAGAMKEAAAEPFRPVHAAGG